MEVVTISWDDIKIEDGGATAAGRISAAEWNTHVSDQKGRIEESVLTAKGDVLAAASASNPTVVNVGTNGQVLMADSTAGSGLAWTTISSSGEANTASNVGSGNPVFYQKAGVDLEFRSLVAGSNITIASSNTELTISSSGGGSGAAATFERKLEGEVYTGTLLPIPIPDELASLDIKEVRISLGALPDGQAFKVQVCTNGTATTDSIFTSDTPIEIGTGESATNGMYITGCNTSGATVGTPGTTIDSARDTLSADDVIYMVISQTGSTTTGADFIGTISIA